MYIPIWGLVVVVLLFVLVFFALGTRASRRHAASVDVRIAHVQETVHDLEDAAHELNMELRRLRSEADVAADNMRATLDFQETEIESLRTDLNYLIAEPGTGERQDQESK
jgi:hypothetical protein